MNTDALTQLVISALEDVKGQDITVLDVREQTDIYRYHGGCDGPVCAASQGIGGECRGKCEACRGDAPGR